jgi:uncharacterized protein (TIGR02266 family)
MAGEDQRQHPRRNIDLSVTLSLESPSHFYVYAGLNVSGGGLFVATDAPLAIGRAVSVRFVLPGWELHPVEATAVVRWIKHGADAGMGVEFTQLSPAARLMIEEFIADRGGAMQIPAAGAGDE